MMVRRHVVGRAGIALQMDARDPGGAVDRIANERIESAWATWGKRGNATPCGRLSWWNVENIAATMLAREGNCLLRILRGPAFGPLRFPDHADQLRFARLGAFGGSARRAVYPRRDRIRHLSPAARLSPFHRAPD